MKVLLRRKKVNRAPRCPRCGSIATQSALSQSEDCISSPYKCCSCGREFGSVPALISARGDEKCSDITIGINIVYATQDEGHTDIELYAVNNHYFITIRWLYGMELSEPYEISLSKHQWQRMIASIYDRAMLFDWKKVYRDGTNNGDEWIVSLKFTHHRSIEICGEGVLPPYWVELKQVISPYLEEARNITIGQKKMFVFVSFEEYGQEYSYLCNDLSVKEGDRVRIPVGYGNYPKIAKVRRVEFKLPEDAPYPIDKIKEVIEKVRDIKGE